MANGYFERGEIYWAKMGSGLGMEMNVTRPALIISADTFNNRSDLVVVVFLSLHGETCPRYVETYATGKLSRILCNQVQSVDKSRFTKLLGVLPPDDMKAVEDALEEVFDLGYVDDQTIKVKDLEIEAAKAETKEFETEVTILKAKLAALEESHKDELLSLRVENEMWQKLYLKALDQVVDMKFGADVGIRMTKPVVVSEPQKPVVSVSSELPKPESKQPESEPVESGLVDINHCTQTALKKLGFSLPMARLIVSRRPYNTVADLKTVPGMKATQFRIMEPKLCCMKMTVEPEKVEVVKDAPDPGYEQEPEVGGNTVKVNVNTVATGAELHKRTGMVMRAATEIVKHRKQFGPYEKLEDLLNLQYFGNIAMKRYGHMLEV